MHQLLHSSAVGLGRPLALAKVAASQLLSSSYSYQPGALKQHPASGCAQPQQEVQAVGSTAGSDRQQQHACEQHQKRQQQLQQQQQQQQQNGALTGIRHPEKRWLQQQHGVSRLHTTTSDVMRGQNQAGVLWLKFPCSCLSQLVSCYLVSNCLCAQL